MNSNNANNEQNGITNLKNTLYIDTLNTNSLHLGKGSNHELKKIYQEAVQTETVKLNDDQKPEEEISDQDVQVKTFVTRNDDEEDDQDNAPLIPIDDEDKKKTVINVYYENLKEIFKRKRLKVIAGILFTVFLILLIAYLSSKKSIQDCPSVNIPLHADVACNTNTSYTIGSTCTFYCDRGYNMKGVDSTTCNSSLKWSHKPPICQKCPPCFVGEKCTESIRWTDLENELNGNAFHHSTMNYAGHPIQCFPHSYSHHLEVYYRGSCIDQNTSQSVNCQGYKSPKDSEKSALATLIRLMVKAQVYPDVCDPSDMAEVTCRS